MRFFNFLFTQKKVFFKLFKMEFILDKKNATEGVIIVNVFADDYADKLEADLKQAAKTVKVNGFREGKVPLEMVRKMYASKILPEVVFAEVEKKLSKYKREQSLDFHIFGQFALSPETPAQDWKKQKDFQLHFNFGYVNDFEIDFSDIQLTDYQIKVTDEEIKKQLDQIQTSLQEIIPTENVGENTQIVFSVDNEKVKEGIAIKFADIKEEYQLNLVGQVVGSTFEFSFEEILKEEAYKSMLAYELSMFEEEELATPFSVTIKSINTFVLPELNSELYKKVFPNDTIETYEDFEARLRTDITKSYTKIITQSLTSDLYQAILKKSEEIEYPTNFIKEWIYFNYEASKGTNQRLSPTQIDELYPSVIQDFYWQIVEKKSAEKYNIEVNDELLLDTVCDDLRRQFGGNIEDSMLRDIAVRFLKSKGDEYMAETFRTTVKKECLRKIYEELPKETNFVTLDEYIAILKAKNNALVEESAEENEDSMTNVL
ncbi:MAG: hypothetical protein EAZ31_04685 [Cytophagia bacterium]|nr:MAG: hypothetical protein EAZ31_04685 [Cytophagia bacterium]